MEKHTSSKTITNGRSLIGTIANEADTKRVKPVEHVWRDSRLQFSSFLTTHSKTSDNKHVFIRWAQSKPVFLYSLCMFVSVSMSHANSGSLTFETEKAQLSLIELFTSEGCSSCPPAERWMSRLLKRDDLWEKFVPVAFHVNYWDRLGWVDRFATPTYTKRQYRYKDSGNLSRVYTPAFLVNGREWQGWFERNDVESGTSNRVGTLMLSVAAEGSIAASFSPLRRIHKKLDLHLAILGFGLQHGIKSGENSGKTLTHDFVVIGYWRKRMDRRDDGYFIEDLLPVVSYPNADKRAIAAWVSSHGSMDSIQVVGGWLTDLK